MAKKETSEVRTKIDEINDSLTKVEMRVQDNKKIIMWACVIVAIVVVAVLGFIYLYLKPSVNKANTAYGMAVSKEAAYQANRNQLDSATRATELVGVLKAYEDAARQGHDGGNNARLMAAVYAYKSGDYNKALGLLKDYDRNDEVIATTSKALEGDCYVNLDKPEDAIKCFQEAQKIANGNPTLAPYCILKEATVQRHLKNYSAEAALYKQILDTYPEYSATTGENYEVYYQRALQQANAKK